MPHKASKRASPRNRWPTSWSRSTPLKISVRGDLRHFARTRGTSANRAALQAHLQHFMKTFRASNPSDCISNRSDRASDRSHNTSDRSGCTSNRSDNTSDRSGCTSNRSDNASDRPDCTSNRSHNASDRPDCASNRNSALQIALTALQTEIPSFKSEFRASDRSDCASVKRAELQPGGSCPPIRILAREITPPRI
jgi:hypothetical protein